MGGRGNNKRPGGQGGGRGGKKAKYLPNKVSNQAFPLGSRGLLITCDSGWEDRAVEEIYGVIEEHYDKLAGTASTSVDTAKDFSAALAAEVAQLKDKKQKRFQMTHVGVKGVVFCEFPKEPASPTPVDVAVSICEEAFNTKTLRGRHVNRLLPVSNTCYASLEEMAKIAPGEMSKEFPKDGPGVNFAVEYEHRSSDKFDRMAVINAFVDVIETPPHKVNLTSASKTILVQIARNSCGVSVVPRYKELCKYNLKTCAQVPEEGDEAAKAGPKETDAQAGDVKEGGAAQTAEPEAQPTEGEEATKAEAATTAAAAATGPEEAGQGQPADAEDAAAVT